MKKLLFVVLLVLMTAGVACAEGVTADVGLALATEPASGFGSTYGLMAGASVDFGKFVTVNPQSGFKPHSERIRFRLDIARFKWEDEKYGVDLEYQRTPIFLGGRYVYPIQDRISVYGEAGLEMSFDRIEVAVCVLGSCESESDEETNTGTAIGGGVIFNITDKFRIAVSARRHEIADPYTSFAAMFGMNF